METEIPEAGGSGGGGGGERGGVVGGGGLGGVLPNDALTPPE